jgi:hypothetical protein
MAGFFTPNIMTNKEKAQDILNAYRPQKRAIEFCNSMIAVAVNKQKWKEIKKIVEK